ncbi:hypothetical protein RND71_025600 [Anisodus tanguticus]|uniref:Uncharacterized protein n=1 Tax=Anisodus tanguticus TaxID=243964 RepID=A0AAE1RSW0_9SOLA|nr:hypothetical protein RND71_025600 [Anisodus tanguticus]
MLRRQRIHISVAESIIYCITILEDNMENIDAEMLMGFEVDDDIREEYFDTVGLCCHIDDEHPVEESWASLLLGWSSSKKTYEMRLGNSFT